MSTTLIEFPNGFEVLKNGPIDNRSTFESIAKRDALQAGQRYEGLLTYVKETGKFYYLKAGLTNADWSEFAVGNSGESPWRKLTLPSRNNWVLKTTENTNAPYKGVSDHPEGVFKVKIEILGKVYDGVSFAQYEALFFHADIDYSSGNDKDIKLVPITPLNQVLQDSYSGGALEPFYKIVDGIGGAGKVGFDLNDGASVDAEEVVLYYPSEVGELVADIQY